MARLNVREPGESRRKYVRRLTRAQLRRTGFDLVRLDNPARRQTLQQAFAHLRHRGIRPATVIDVGVSIGTPELYAIFPEAYYLLVEPVAEVEGRLKELVSDRLRGEYALVAAASRRGTITLQIGRNPLATQNVGMYERKVPEVETVERQVPAVPLDELVNERALKPPFLLKIDVEGAELEVLAGAEKTLTQSLAVALEVAVQPIFFGAPLFVDVVRFMDERGFAVYDIVGGFNRRNDRALALVDVVFMPVGQV